MYLTRQMYLDALANQNLLSVTNRSEDLKCP